MSDGTKIFTFPEAGASGGNNSIDPALLMALNNNGGFGGNGNWMWIIFLFFLYPLMRNGGFGNWGNNGNDGTGYLANLANNDTGRELLMSAIQGNQQAINSLATQLNCDINSVKSAINSEMSAIQNVGNQVGMSSLQTINAVQSGNTALGQQIASCCCENRLAIANQTSALQSAINTVNTGLERGFSSNAYESQAQTCAIQNTVNLGVQSIKDATVNQTTNIIAKLDQMQANALQDKINDLQEQRTQLQNQISQEQQNQAIQAMINPLQQELNAIKAAQPATATVTYPNLVGVPMNQYVGYGYNNSFWN